MKTRTWVLIFAALVLVCAAGLLLLRLTGQDAQTAEIWSDGKLYRTVNLSDDQALTVPASGGSNTVVIEGGKVFVTEATCPDGVCIAHGAAGAGDPIVCLPNRLIIRLTGTDEAGLDAVAN